MNSKTSVNLLSPSYVTKRFAKRAMRQWSVVAGLGLLFVSFWLGYEYYSLQRANDRLEYAKTEYAQQRKAKVEIKKLTEQRNVLKQRERATFELEDNVPLLDLVGIVGRAASGSDGKIHLKTFQYGEPIATGKRRIVADRSRNLRLAGIAQDNVAIARFAASIRDSKVFDSVELASTGPAKETGSDETNTSHRTFDIQCSLAVRDGRVGL